jgi:hypothetical protein
MDKLLKIANIMGGSSKTDMFGLLVYNISKEIFGFADRIYNAFA